jgi:hypothetical protein
MKGMDMPIMEELKNKINIIILHLSSKENIL